MKGKIPDEFLIHSVEEEYTNYVRKQIEKLLKFGEKDKAKIYEESLELGLKVLKDFKSNQVKKMLLRSIKASNFMKYNSLDISNIPEKGIISILGDNESGKSTIGEIITFGLFGCSTRFEHDSLTQLINWDSDECEVKITFSVEDNTYTITRSLSRNGTQNAILHKGIRGGIIKKGGIEVTKAVEGITKFNFENFRHTFYLAQKEIDVIIREMKLDSKQILHKMLGFDMLSKASEYFSKENFSLKAKRDKCENELLLTKSILSKIKTDTSYEKKLSEKIEELKIKIKSLTEEIKEKDKNSEENNELLKTRENLDLVFNNLQQSFKFNFYKESLTRAINNLSKIYYVIKEEKEKLIKNILQKDKSLEKISQKSNRIFSFSNEVQELLLIIQNYKESIEKKIKLPDNKSKTPPEDNILIALKTEEKKLERIAKRGLLSILLTVCCIIYSVFSFIFVIFLNYQEEFFLFDYNILEFYYTKHVLWASFLLSFFLVFISLATIFYFKEIIKKIREVCRELEKKIEILQNEVDICQEIQKNMPYEIRYSALKLKDSQTHEKLKFLEKHYKDYFIQDFRIDESIKKIKDEKLSQEKALQASQERLKRIENFIRLIESIEKGSLIQIQPTAEDKKILEDIDKLENRIYKLIETAKDKREKLLNFSKDLEVEKSWQEYEQARSKFRKLSGLVSIGGGTGMLNRIQSAFKQKNEDKLIEILKKEKENFFPTLPVTKDLKNEATKAKEELVLSEEKLKSSEDDLEKQKNKYEKSIEELESKKDLLNKINALNNQLNNLDNSIKMNEITKQLMEETLESVTKRFGPSIARIMSKVLPRITQGRYHHVQVLDSLKINAFSQEKNDFVEFSELSGGTIDQLYLSLRLAFAQAVVTAKLGGGCQQFLFFDEPMISFDEERSFSFLDLLSNYNKNFVQIFFISPRNFNSDLFEMVVNTDIKQHELKISGHKTRKTKKRLKKKTDTEEAENNENEEYEEEDDGEEDEEVEDIEIEYDEGEI